MRILAAMILTAASLFTSAPARKNDRAEMALRAAIDKETVDGDLKGAIDEYVKLAQSSNREVAARALLRTGQCYEKLGDSEARKAYERLIRDFADQAEVAREAQARLVALKAPIVRIPFRGAHPIHPIAPWGGLSVSPDGKHLAYKSRDDKIRLLPLAGGPSQVLVEGVRCYWWASGLAWSPDGTELAYTNNDRIWKVNLQSRKSEELQTGLDAIHMNMVWSPDGKTTAFGASQGGEPELWLMPEFQPLLRPERHHPGEE